MKVSEALKARISIRAFLDRPVPIELVRQVVEAGRWAPSGGNLQPWRIIALAGEERDAVCALAKRVLLANPAGEGEEFPSYPKDLGEPYLTRRRVIAEDMYEALEIPWGDKPARIAWVARNYDFFDAPVGLFFVIDRAMGRSQWAHMGMLMQSIALVAVELGLGTCMQECWARARKSLHAHFELGEDEVLYCGMALGYPDPEAPVNRLRSERAEVDDIAEFRGF